MKVYRIGYYQVSRTGFLNLRSANLVGLSSALEFCGTDKAYEKREKWGELVVKVGQELRGKERKYEINTEKDT